MPRIVTSPQPPPPEDPLAGSGLIAVNKALKTVLAITRPTAWEWIKAGVLPPPIRPLRQNARGRLYWRKDDLRQAINHMR